MTLCIAAHCEYEGEPHIVLCCDWLSSDDYGSSETCDKISAIKPGWPTLIAATVHKADEFVSWFERLLDPTRINELNALETIRTISHSYLAKLRDEQSLLLYGSTVPQLIKDKAFERKEIESISSMLSSGAELIICTIVNGKTPFIWELRPNGEVVQQSDYAIIGSPAQASAFVQWRCVTGDDDLATVLYHVYEAKRFAEMDSSIGPETSMYVLKPSGDVHRVKGSYLKTMDKLRKDTDRARERIKLPEDWLCSKPDVFEF
jgi:20S proteasome alpha/beta subunit